jgi:hypothetical protein
MEDSQAHDFFATSPQPIKFVHVQVHEMRITSWLGMRQTQVPLFPSYLLPWATSQTHGTLPLQRGDKEKKGYTLFEGLTKRRKVMKDSQRGV